MHKVEKFKKNNVDIDRFFVGKQIVEFKWQRNDPLYDDCIKMVLHDGTEISIFSFMRVMDNNLHIFSITDFWLDEDVASIGKFIEEKLVGLRIESIKFNNIGDCVLYLSNRKKIQVFIDGTVGEPDYLIIDTENEYFRLSRIDNELSIVVGQM